MYPCEDPECECCNHDEFLKNEDWERAATERRKAKKLARKAELEELKKKNAILRELLKQAMKERHYTLPPAPQFYNSQPRSAHCGAPIGTSIDTCEYCRPYREALANA